MSNRFTRSNSVFVQQGSSNTLRVRNELLFNVVKEEWEGSNLLNTFIISSHETEESANTARDIYKAASALGRKGGSATSRAKKKSSAANGKLGGRPKSKDKGANQQSTH